MLTPTPLGILGVGQLAAHLVKGLRRAGVDRPILLLPRSRGIALELTRDWGCRSRPTRPGWHPAAGRSSWPAGRRTCLARRRTCR